MKLSTKGLEQCGEVTPLVAEFLRHQTNIFAATYTANKVVTMSDNNSFSRKDEVVSQATTSKNKTNEIRIENNAHGFISSNDTHQPNRLNKKRRIVQAKRPTNAKVMKFSEKEQLQKEGEMKTIPVPKSLDNPLGVSVWHLITTFKEQTYDYVQKLYEKEEKEKDPNDAVIYEIEDLQKETGFIRQKGENVVCKEDGELGDSYVNCLEGKDNVGPATHMLSYSWGNKISHIISSLFSYCCTNNLDPKRTYIWICCLCINQHRVKAMMERGEDVPFEDFGRVFEERVVKIGNVLTLMVPWEKPIYLTRVWCIYETYTALIKNCILSTIMPEEEKENLMNTIKGMTNETTDLLWKVLASTRIENATASVPSDKDNILKLIESSAGYVEVNNKVNARLREWIDETIVEMVKKVEENSNDITSDEDLAVLYNRIGIVYNQNGKHDVALEYYKKNLAIKMIVYGEDHKETATAYYCIGLAYNKKGEYDDALEHFKKALSIEKITIGEEHENKAMTYNQIGQCYMWKNEFKTALENYDKSLSIKKKIHGEMHHSIATTFGNIALCYSEKGEKDVALQKYFECLRIKENVLDEGHPEFALTYQNIGILYYNMNNLTDDEKYTKMAINIREKVLGPDHPETLKSKGWYEGILAELEYYDVEKEKSRKKQVSYTKDSLWGNTFCQKYFVGFASYHFLNPNESISNNNSETKFEAYISYEHPKMRFLKFDDGSPVPRKVPFQNIQWDTVINTFRGSIYWSEEYGTTLYGDRKWEYELKFDSSYTCIVSGTCSKFGKDDVAKKVTSFGTDKLCINARVKDWYDSASSLPSFCIPMYFSQEGITDKLELKNMLEEVLFKDKCIRY